MYESFRTIVEILCGKQYGPCRINSGILISPVKYTVLKPKFSDLNFLTYMAGGFCYAVIAPEMDPPFLQGGIFRSAYGDRVDVVIWCTGTFPWGSLLMA